jgi:enamine deaminase RidA (YjgF/YER057c/UK114 family)
MKLVRDPDDVHPPLAAYSHQIEIRGERLLALSGQVGVRPDGSLTDDPLEQLDIALDNVERNLAAAGMGVTDLVKVTLYLVGDIDPAERRTVIGRHLGDHRPCLTLVVPAALANASLRVEIDCWASAEEPG